ncbi:General transcription and DNA repair factor IIH subunit TFB4 [Linum perenne]
MPPAHKFSENDQKSSVDLHYIPAKTLLPDYKQIMPSISAMTTRPSQQTSDDVSLVVVLVDINPFFWSTSPSLSLHQFLSHVLAFLNSVVLLNQLNQIVVIATGHNSCDYVYDSSLDSDQLLSGNGESPAFYTVLLQRLEEFVSKDENLGKQEDSPEKRTSSLLSGSLSMALCYIQRVFRSGPLHPQPRASYITGGVYVKPQHLDGLFQYLVTVFAVDLHSRDFLQLPRPAGVDFRASCFCHKTTIDMGYVCSVCLSIFCKRHQKCSTCGSEFPKAQQDASTESDRKRKAPEA